MHYLYSLTIYYHLDKHSAIRKEGGREGGNIDGIAVVIRKGR